MNLFFNNAKKTIHSAAAPSDSSVSEAFINLPSLSLNQSRLRTIHSSAHYLFIYTITLQANFNHNPNTWQAKNKRHKDNNIKYLSLAKKESRHLVDDFEGSLWPTTLLQV